MPNETDKPEAAAAAQGQEEEEVDIDLTDPEVEKAAIKIQAGFGRFKKSKTSGTDQVAETKKWVENTEKFIKAKLQ